MVSEAAPAANAAAPRARRRCSSDQSLRMPPNVIGHESRNEHGRHFSDHDRIVVHEYYQGEFRRGKCPPGLAKKHNGCLPPGQAKKWHVGQRLPGDIVYYELPPAVIVQLPPPSAGRRYVRVASDILVIAVGTGVVIDAIQDLGRM